MKSTKILSQLVFLVITGFLVGKNAHAQDAVPAEVSAIVNMQLEVGQAKLTTLGYEICGSSFFGKKQDWYNETTENCVTVRFNKSKEITEVLVNPETSECQRKLEAARRIWENYHDGQAPVSNPKIDAERKKLADQGFRASYWINDVSPGRSSEYWVNETTQNAMFIVWEVQGNKWVMTEKTDYSNGKNPAPSNK